MTTRSPLTQDDLKALREVAERARKVTAPDWTADLYRYPLGDTGDYDHCAVVLAQFGDIMTPRPFANVEDLSHNAEAQRYLTEYIAKFDPATIDSLLDEIETRRKRERDRAETEELYSNERPEQSTRGTERDF